MLKKVITIILFIILICINFFTQISNAVFVRMTDENLKSTFENSIKSKASEGGYNISDISVVDNIIEMIVNGKKYTLNYNLTDKPTFFLEIPIKKGMSYQEFINITNEKILVLPLLGYIAFTDIQGIDYEDLQSYLIGLYLSSRIDGTFSLNGQSSYEIVDDLNSQNNIEKDENSKIIYTSDFPEKVIEYVNDLYSQNQIFTDENGINSFTLTIEKKEETKEICKIISTITINPESDYSSLIKQQNNKETEEENKDISTSEQSNTETKQSNTKEKQYSESPTNNNNNNNDKTISGTKLPKTGKNNMIIIIAFLGLIAIMLCIKNKEYKDIK